MPRMSLLLIHLCSYYSLCYQVAGYYDYYHYIALCMFACMEPRVFSKWTCTESRSTTSGHLPWIDFFMLVIFMGVLILGLVSDFDIRIFCND